MQTTQLQIDTHDRRTVDITDDVRAFANSADADGLLHVFVPHATAGLALDLVDLLERLLPRTDRYHHRHGPVGHGGDHLLPVFVSPSLVVPVVDGDLALGMWQRVVVVDPNETNDRRSVRLSFIPG
jgi:secondary thiamine-phosphate synthase enzyme